MTKEEFLVVCRKRSSMQNVTWFSIHYKKKNRFTVGKIGIKSLYALIFLRKW